MISTYYNHVKTFEEGLNRDITDVILSAKNEAIAAGKESANYLTDYVINKI